MTIKNGGTYTPKVSGCSPEHQTGRQQDSRLFEHHPGHVGRRQPGPVSHQTAAAYKTRPTYPDADQFSREASHECNDGAEKQDAGRSAYQPPHNYGRKATHQAEPQHGNAWPYGRVDRTQYHTVSDGRGSGVGHRLSEGRAAVGSQAHDPLQRYLNEPMKEVPWNGIDGFQPIGVSSTGKERKRQQYHSASSSGKAENGSSTSFGYPY